jgi:PPP family 3-phenylpropionic acid transporter
MIGAISPFFPVFLRSDRGLSATQIGEVLALSQVALMISPVILTFLADRWLHPKFVALIMYGIGGTAVLFMWQTNGFAAIALSYLFFSLASSALLPTVDGLFFAVQRNRTTRGLPTPAYHNIRFLGTVGFIVPSIVLLVLIPSGGSLNAILPTAIVFAALAGLNALALPDPRVREKSTLAVSRLPTLDAVRALFSRRYLAFCLAMALVQVAHAAYYGFYPVHLVQSLDVNVRWLGTIMNMGVAVEAAMMLGFGWMTVKYGVKNLLLWGCVFTGVRLLLVAVSPTAAPAILANLLHGMVSLGTLVAPVVFINRLAGDTFRNSMQGVFTVAVLGPARIVGNLLSGNLAEIDTRVTFVVGAVLAFAAAIIMFYFVSDPPEESIA